MAARIFVFVSFLAFVFANKEHLPSLKGMQGISITCDNLEKLAKIRQFEGQRGFSSLKRTQHPHENIQVLVTEDLASKFKDQLDSHGIDYKVDIKDVQKFVDIESRAQNLAQEKRARSFHFYEPYDFKYFPRQEKINEYMKEMAKNYEDITLFSIGRSFEGREMYGVKVSQEENKTKPAILIDAGIHAREWIAPVTALFAISQLVKESNKHLYKNVDWYIIPSMNPDGYEFTHTTYRFWRKTRSNSSNPECFGVDGNRNFDFKWMESGASANPCRGNFGGEKAFSEVESQNLRDFILSRNGSIQIYVTLHSYGKLLGFPWAYTKELHEKYLVLKSVAEKAAKALSALRGTTYTVDGVARILYEASGGTLDWAMAIGGVDLSYVFELPGDYFHVQPEEIIPIGEETFEAFKVFGKYVEETYVN